jgi:hypothetical protein
MVRRVRNLDAKFIEQLGAAERNAIRPQPSNHAETSRFLDIPEGKPFARRQRHKRTAYRVIAGAGEIAGKHGELMWIDASRRSGRANPQ